MCGAILEATDSSFQKDMPFCRSICMKKVMKLLAFTFEQPSYKFIEFVLLILLAKTLKKADKDQKPMGNCQLHN